ncbi:MAG: alpha/beta fold hydrolase [Elusimicrobia bacterium]|nr:alpha/beta fold hydrolase [Elusimicrobiota bacterium]
MKLRALYPFQPHFLPLEGGRLHFLDEGSGEPIVLLHGNPSWSFMYRDLIRDLRSSYRCVAPDHMGCGLSDKPGDDLYDYTLARRVDDLERLLDALGLREGLTLLAHDWGGMIGMAYASRHPERVKRLVLCNTAAFLNPKGMRLPWQLKLGRDSWLGAWLIRGFNAFALGASYLGCRRKPMSPEARAGYLAPYDSWANRIATLRFVQDIPLVPSDRSYTLVAEVQAGLHRFRETPLMLCWGEKDFVFDGRFLEEWLRRFPEAEVHRFPDAGHYVVEDAGAEIAALTRRFLAAHPLAAGASRP